MPINCNPSKILPRTPKYPTKPTTANCARLQPRLKPPLPQTPIMKPGTPKEAHFLIDPRYSIECVLGKGSYGTVCAAVDTKGVPVRVAVKKVSNIFHKEVLMRRAVREMKLMVHFRGHRNVSRPTIGVWNATNNRSSD